MATRSPQANGDESGDIGDDPGVTSPYSAQSSTNGHRQPQSSSRKGARTLTPAQLEKKRANDREAQRAIRERTKSQIETLEKRIKDLESGESYKQLQEALRQKQVVEAENDDLKRRLTTVYQILVPLFPGGQFQDTTNPQPRGVDSASITATLGDSASINSRFTPSASRDPYNPHLTSHEASPSAATGGWSRRRSSLTSPGPPWEPSSKFNSGRHHRPSDETPEAKPMVPPMSTNGTLTPPSNYHRAHYEGSIGSHGPPAPGVASPQPPSPAQYTALPNNINPTCKYDQILFDFTSESRLMVQQGKSLSDILGGGEPVMTCLVDPRSEMIEKHYFSGLLIELLKGFSEVTRITEKAAIVYNLFTFIQWMISPTKETWNALPPYMYPVESQLKVPHPMWVDHIPWPAMRHKMVYQYPWLPLDNFFLPYTKQLRLDYPGNDAASCLYRDPNSGEMYMLPELRERIRNLDNLSLGPVFAKALPMLADTCNIKET